MMKKILLSLVVATIGFSSIQAQTIQVGAPKKMSTQESQMLQNLPEEVKAQPYSLGKESMIQLPAKYTMQTIGAKTFNPKLRATSAEGSFFESFESYDGKQADWLPEGWTELNKTGAQYDPITGKNKTWYVQGYTTGTTDGRYYAWINFDSENEQDEWLISPSFVPRTDEFLFFDLHYSPFYMYYKNVERGVWDFDFDNPTVTLQVYASNNDGASWNLLWDAHNTTDVYTTANINNYAGVWRGLFCSLSPYVNQSIKIAFRYVGKNGDSMALDNIRLDKATPQASYIPPRGYFHVGVSPNFYTLTTQYLLGNAYSPSTWRNQSNSQSEFFAWEFEKPENTKEKVVYSDRNPIVTYPAGTFKVPTLTAGAGSRTSTYFWGSERNPGSFVAGGGFGISDGNGGVETFGSGNYDLEKGIAAYQNSQGEFIFGTTSDQSIDGVANYFEAPEQPYAFRDMWITLSAFKAPDDAKFELIIHRVESAPDGNGLIMTDTIATAVCTAADVIGPINEANNALFSLPFNRMKMKDPETGLYYTDALVIDEDIFVELKGFNKPGIELAVFSQVMNVIPNNFAYIFVNQPGSGRTLTSYNGNTALLFNLNVVYPYLHTENPVFNAPTTGGRKDFAIGSPFVPTDWWLETSLPDWIEMSYEYDSTTSRKTLSLITKALPNGVAGRSETITIFTYGTSLSIQVNQGTVLRSQEVTPQDIEYKKSNFPARTLPSDKIRIPNNNITIVE